MQKPSFYKEMKEPQVPEFEDLMLKGEGNDVTITLNRPKVINALSIRLSEEFHRALDYIRVVERFKVVVITGAGENFCAGDDLTEMASGAWGDVNQSFQRVRQYQDMANTLEELDKMTIAAVDGHCVGGGLEITMACDFVICTERSRWGMPEVDWNITPGWGGTTRMSRLIGRRMTKEINLLGALHKAQRGVDLGLFNRVVDNEKLASETRALVNLLLMKHQQGLRQLKFIIARGVETDQYTAQGYEAMSAAMTAAVLMENLVADSNVSHGWLGYQSKDSGSDASDRRKASIDFWVD